MKNKRIYLLIIFLLVFILNTKFCYAEIYKGKLTGESVYLRSGPGTNYESLKSLSKGSEYNLVDNTLHKSENESCSKGWYKIYYEGSATGYVCSDYIEVSVVTFNETHKISSQFTDEGKVFEFPEV